MAEPAAATSQTSEEPRRELLDTLVIFSIAAVASAVTVYTDALSGLRSLSAVFDGPQLDGLTITLLFFGIALAVFGSRRMIDQRLERGRRIVAEERARTLTYQDGVTGLPNRRKFEQTLDESLKSVGSAGACILVAQMNGLNDVQQLYGQAGVERALKNVADRFRALSEGVLLARFGDDEFAFALLGEDVRQVKAFAARILRAAKEVIEMGGSKQSLHATLGIAISDEAGQGVSELLRCAHVALHHAKLVHLESCLFEPGMDELIRDRLTLERDLRDALGTDQICPHYQPIIDIASGRIVSFEALARWTHPQRGPIGPAVFIPMAEELGIIDELTGQLFGKACQDATQWPDHISLSFNFSPCQLGSPSLAEGVLVTMAEIGLATSRLEAEITEGALFANLTAAKEVLSILRAAGVRIVMDDFGTGYSSLYHLRQLQFDKLKIDRSFIEGIAEDPDSAVIVRSIMGMSNALDLVVTAEGIENVRQALGVTSHGVHQAQGFLYGRPMPASEALTLALKSAPPKQREQAEGKAPEPASEAPAHAAPKAAEPLRRASGWQ